ncbi:hypothetical protein [Actinoplanes sp. NPDC049802]|uniref:hypothetical protein n=1 Tax=Actinoplanes sp. NPDC049802 TaxID=3154742 RepID=UPI0033CFE413
MERGPLALFGAIVAVGLGPALWLGAQLGAVDLAPGQRPAPVNEQFPGVDMDFGGSGAGDPAVDPMSTHPLTPHSPAAPAKRKTKAATRDPVRQAPSPSPVSPSASPSLSPSLAPSLSPSGPPPSDEPAPPSPSSPEVSEPVAGSPDPEPSTR